VQKHERVFLISPVRDIDEAVEKEIKQYVSGLEAEGHTVYWPKRDTNQDDPIGLRICQDNREALYQSTSVHMWVARSSQGSIFDLGMLYYFLGDTRKAFKVINETALGCRTPLMTLENVLFELGVTPNAFWRKSIYVSGEIWIEVKTNVPDRLFFMGMAFASLRSQNKKIFLSNQDQISRTPTKSFENVFLELAQAS
jgi:hypothetical protein